MTRATLAGSCARFTAKPAPERLKVLVLALRYPHRASYFDDWADAFATSPLFNSSLINLLDCSSAQLKQQIDEHDLVVALHSCTGDTTDDLERLAPVLAERGRTRFVAFVGNEFNSPYAPLSQKLATLRDCNPDIVATQLLPEAGHYLYGDICHRVISLPHALNPDVFYPGSHHSRRRIDIGVRCFRYSPSLGDKERNSITDYFRLHGAEHGFTVDIDSIARFGRKEWAEFLASCRGTVSSEAGSWYLDRDDALVNRIHEEITRQRSGLVIGPSKNIGRFVRRLPLPMKSALAWALRYGPIKFAIFEDENLDFEDIYQRFFAGAPRCPVYSKALSSRHFDAIGTQTCQILVAGRYNDLLVPYEHYIPVKADLSNVGEAISRFKDQGERERIAVTAYEYTMTEHTYRHRMNALYHSLQSF